LDKLNVNLSAAVSAMKTFPVTPLMLCHGIIGYGDIAVYVMD